MSKTYDSNINRLFALIKENKQYTRIIFFLSLYPFPLCSVYLLLVKQGQFTVKGLGFSYLIISILFLLRLVFRKIELQLGLLLSGWKEKQAGILAFFLDILFTLLCLLLFFEIPLYESCLFVLSLLIYEFLILFKL